MSMASSSHSENLELRDEITADIENQPNGEKSVQHGADISNIDIQLRMESASHLKSPNEYQGINSVFFETEVDLDTTTEVTVDGNDDNEDCDIDPLYTCSTDVIMKLEEPSALPEIQHSYNDKDSGAQQAATKSVSQNERSIFRCKQCKFTANAASVKDITKHLSSHPRLGEEPYACEFCGFKSFSRTNHREHISIHAPSKMLCCALCSYKTPLVYTLKKHIMGHNGVKPFSCKYCSFTTGNVTNLKSHIMLHTGEKPFACDRCSYKTNQKSALKRHINNKSEVKPFSCEFCAFKSCAKSTFKTHVASHNAE